MTEQLSRLIEIRIVDYRGRRIEGARLTIFADNEKAALIRSTRDKDPIIHISNRSSVITVEVECDHYIDPIKRANYNDTVTLSSHQHDWEFAIPHNFKTKPTIFIGCSVEARREARLIQEGLSQHLHYEYNDIVITWWQDDSVFPLSLGTLEALVERAPNFTHAVLIFTPDDMLIKRAEEIIVARDNVLFELGLFIGTLGREHTFIVAERSVRLPSDLAGITTATFQRGESMQIVVTRLLRAMGFM